MPKVVFADEQDDLASLRSKLEAVDDPRVAVVIPPHNRALSTPVAIRILHHQAESLALELSLISRAAAVREAAAGTSLRVFANPRQYQRSFELTGNPFWETLASAVEWFGHVSAALTAFLVLAVLVLGLGLVYVFLPEATVTVVPRTDRVSGTISLVADPTVRAIDYTAGKIPARVIYLQVDANDSVEPREVAAADGGRASGTVKLTNRRAQETVVPPGSIVLTADGTRFRTDGEIRLSASGTGQAGQVRVVAVDSGPNGNVPKGRIDRIDGALASAVQVQNDDPTAGGGAPGKRIVTADDRAKLQSQAIERGRTEALAKLQTMPGKRDFLVKDSIEYSLLETTFDHEVGEESSQLNVRVKARAAATIVDLEDVEDYARSVWKPTIRPGYQMTPEGVRFLDPTVTKYEGRAVTLAARLEANTLAQINVNRVQQIARWRTAGEVSRDVSQAFDLANRPVVRISPEWMGRAYRVRVVVDVTGVR